jgi:hypothetical protein
VAAGVAPDAVDLEIMLHQWGLVKEPYVAWYGQVAVSDVAVWSEYGVRPTSKNLRQFREAVALTSEHLSAQVPVF